MKKKIKFLIYVFLTLRIIFFIFFKIDELPEDQAEEVEQDVE